MKEVANMGPDDTSKMFSHVQEKQQLDSSTIGTNDSVKKSDIKNSLITNPDSTGLPATADSISEERDHIVMEPEEENIVPTQDVKPDIPQVHEESVRFYDTEDKESRSYPPDNDNNPFNIGIKLWQAYNIAWINAYNEFMKAWMDMIKSWPK